MPSPIPDNWGANPPHALAVGDGPYTTVLAACFGAAAFPAASLKAGAQLNARGGHTRLLEDLERVFLVVPEDMQPAEALHCHRLVWNLVEQFSSAGEQHDLAFLFVLPARRPAQLRANPRPRLSGSRNQSGHNRPRRVPAIRSLL